MNSKWSRCVEKGKLKKGPWTFEEDIRLLRYIRTHGDGRWTTLAKAAGLQRCGKSCRLRWVNYLRPGIKRGNITAEEERVIIDLHARWGNRWSLIAERIPGRTDNEIKNYWRSHLKKKLQKSAQTGDQKSTSGTTQPLAMSQVQAKQQNLEVFTVINAIEPSYEDNFDHGVVKVDNLQDMKTDIDQLHCLYAQSPFLGNSEGMGIGMAGQDADELAPMFHSLPWGIPIESDAAANFEASYSANGGGVTELYGAADGCESDTGADIMLWNMCPIPNMELDTPFLSAPRPLGHVNGQTPFPPFSVN